MSQSTLLVTAGAAIVALMLLAFWKPPRRGGLWLLMLLLCWPCSAAEVRTANFVIHGNFAESFLRQAAAKCEADRRALAIAWLGQPLENWKQPCDVELRPMAERFSGGGATTLTFGLGDSGVWLGSPEKLLVDIIPHEVCHLVLATAFGKPLPRWADEGMACQGESAASKNFQRGMLISALNSRRGIPTHHLVAFRDYPRDCASFYAQSCSQVAFLVEQGGRPQLISTLEAADCAACGGWPAALREHYGYDHLQKFQDDWLSWIRAGSPANATDRKHVAGYGAWQWDPYAGRWVRVAPQPRTGGVILGLTGPYGNTAGIGAGVFRPQPQCAMPSHQTQPARVETQTGSQQGTPGRRGPVGPEGPVGPVGPQGPPGRPGEPAEIDYDVLAGEVLARLPPLRVQRLDGQGAVFGEEKLVRLGEALTLPANHLQNFDPAGRLVDEEWYPVGMPIKLRHGGQQ